MVLYEINKKISALYYLLNSISYDYSKLDREKFKIKEIDSFKDWEILRDKEMVNFVSKLKNKFSKEYEYWPKLYLMEIATFFIKENLEINISDFIDYTKKLNNIEVEDLDQEFFDGIKILPNIINTIINKKEFENYIEYTRKNLFKEIEKNNGKIIQLNNDIAYVLGMKNLKLCIKVIIDPIKCVYSADNIILNNTYYLTLGEFRLDGIFHEFLHFIIKSKNINSIPYSSEEIIVRKATEIYIRNNNIKEVMDFLDFNIN